MPIPERSWLAARALALGLVLFATSDCRSGPPAYAEALVVVDTDLPVPQIAGRLRVDLYDSAGNWYSSRDEGLPGPYDWPASFGVYSTNESSDTLVLMRLRVYPDGFVRDYLGEQYQNDNGPLPQAAGPNDMAPRLVIDGVDVTPPTEPQPLVTVDRLVLLQLQPGVRGRVRVTMRGECAGTMALLSQTPPYQTPSIHQAATCLAKENTLSLLVPAPLEPNLSVPPATQLGTFGAGPPCEPEEPRSRARCVPGGPFILGDKLVIDMGPPYDGVPQRVVAIGRFWLDRNEVTVGQLRAALSAGFYRDKPLPIGTHDGVLGEALATDEYGPPSGLDRWCTWSTHPMGREDYPLSCVAWDFARDYCEFVGGELTTEAEWEYAAAAGSRLYKTEFPWGNDLPTCSEVITDRYSLNDEVPSCPSAPGPRPIMTTPYDSTPGEILDMGGSQAELMIDSLAEYSAPCWLRSSLHDPSCVDPSITTHVLRGGSWASPTTSLLSAWRSDSGLANIRAIYGFRCTFGAPPGSP
jgi:formylglycine-generating enzyme required for sulfatase activity